MSYLGIDPNTPLLNTSTQTFSGNAAATQFTLNRAVASASDLDVMIGNVMQRPFTDYTAGNVTLLFTSPPASGTQNITVTYRGGALNSLDLTASVFNAGTEGNPSVYSLAGENTGIYWPSSTSVGVTISGANRTIFNANATSVSSTTGALVVQGGAGIGGNLNTSGNISTTSITESTSVYTGALKIGGGAGIVGNLNVGGDITCVGDFTVNGTFTTTGTDSLEVNDPFIFLANANPGDTYDSGVISQYFDGTNTRYTGYFRDITDNKYKLFGNLLPKPGTTVDTGNASFQLQDLVLANVSATGNVNAAYFVGNGAALTGISTDTTQIFNANSRVIIASPNSSIVANVNGTTISTTSSTGFAVTGLISASTTIAATGNISGGNVTTAGQVSSAGNISAGTGNVSGGNLLTGGLISATATITGGNLATAGTASAGGNITGGNIRTAGLMSATGDVYGNNFSATTAITAGTTIGATTSITAGTTISAAGDVQSGAQVSAAGNIIGANVNTGGLSLSGNVLSAVNTTANITTTANISGGNISVTGSVTVNTALITGSATLLGASATYNDVISSNKTTGTATIGGTAQTGFITVGRSTATQPIYIANGVTSSGNTKTLSIGENGAAGSTTTIAIGAALGAGSATFNAATPVAIANTGGSALSVAGNVTGGNLITSGTGGNITGANVVSATTFNGTTVSVTGNVTGGNIITGGALSVTGAISATGNVTGGNIIAVTAATAGSGGFSATGNVTGGNINTAGLMSATGNIIATANVSGGNILATTLVQGVTVSASGNVVGGNLNAAGLSLSGNVISALSMITNITTTANIVGGNISTAGNLAAPTAATNTNTTQVATTAYVLGQLSSTTPAAIADAGAVGTGTTFARADHTHSGVTSITGTANQVTASASAGAVTLSLPQSIATSSAVQFGSLTVTTGNITLGNIVNAGANGVGNIGAVGGYFNTVFAKATSAQYADLAENYLADAEYAPGTVLVFGGNNEVTISTVDADARVAGVVSTNPAHLMNGCLMGDNVVALALTGRVPTQVVGTVRKGDMMVSAGNGHAQACATPAIGTVIGKAVENFDGATGTIEIVVGRI